MEYLVEILKFGELPELSEQKRNVIIVGRLDGIDTCVRFFCPCESATPIYIPFGKMNREKGIGERTITWSVPDKVLSLTPSIKVSGCGCHYHFINNRTT